MKKSILTTLIAFASLAAFSQEKKPFKVYYIPFTEQQYLSLQKQIIHADSLLSGSEAKSKDVSPARDIMNNVLSAFQQSYIRKDTLQLQPAKNEKSKN